MKFVYIQISLSINKVLLEHSHAYSNLVNGFCAAMADVTSSNRDNLPVKPRIFTI